MAELVDAPDLGLLDNAKPRQTNQQEAPESLILQGFSNRDGTSKKLPVVKAVVKVTLPPAPTVVEWVRRFVRNGG